MTHHSNTISDLLEAPRLKQTLGYQDHIAALGLHTIRCMEDNGVGIDWDTRLILLNMYYIHHGIACDILTMFKKTGFLNLELIVEETIKELYSSDDQDDHVIASSMEHYLLK